MSETSEAKSTRLFIKQLSNPIWSYQISVFYEKYTDSLEAVNDKSIITDLLPRMFPDQPFLYRLCLNESASSSLFTDTREDASFEDIVVAPYHTIFTNQVTDIKKYQERLSSRLNRQIWLKRRLFSPLAKHRYISSLKRGSPHDLNSFFKSDVPVKRTAMIGKRYVC